VVRLAPVADGEYASARVAAFHAVHLGFSTADAEDVQLQFDGSDVTLEFRDWSDQDVKVVFREVLGFRWSQWQDEVAPRDDESYEVLGSEWLQREFDIGGTGVVRQDFAHYRLCFSACGVLDVLSRRIG